MILLKILNNKIIMANTTLVLHFRSGTIWGESGARKKWMSAKRMGRRIWSSTENPGSTVGFRREAADHPVIEGPYQSEFEVYELGKNPPTVRGRKRVGSFIYPYIKGAKNGSLDTNRVVNDDGDTVNKNDEFSKKKLRWVIDKANHSNHYLQKHCYYNLQAFGEQFAKYYGVEPLRDGSGDYGIDWGIDIAKFVGWRIIITWGNRGDLLYYDGLVKEDLVEGDASQAILGIAKAIGTITTAAITGGLSVAAATATGAANVGQAIKKGIEMSERTYEDSGRKFEWKDVDSERVADAWIESREDKAEAKEEADRLKGAAIGRSFRGMSRLFSGGRSVYHGGIDDWINKIAGFAPLHAQVRTSEHYDALWKQKMNERLLNFYFPFGTDPELALKENFGTEVGSGRKILGKIHGWIKFSPQIFFGPVNQNAFLDYGTRHDFFVYQKEEKRPKRTIDDFYQGINKSMILPVANREAYTDVKEWTTVEVRTHTSKDFVSGAFVFCGIWCSDENVSIPTGKRGNFEISDATDTTDRKGNERWKRLLAKDGASQATGYVGDDECQGHYTSPDMASKIAAYKGKPYRMIYWGANKSPGSIIFGAGAAANTVVGRYLRGNSLEEEIRTKADDEMWALEVNPGYDNGISLVKFKETEEEIKHRMERNTNRLNLEITVPVFSTGGLEGWGNNPPDGFSSSGGEGGMSEPPSFAQKAFAEGGLSLPDTNPLKIDSSIPEAFQSTLNTDINMDISVELPELPNMEQIANMNQMFNQENIDQQHHIHEDLHQQETNRQKDKEKITEK
jgi:hypothetical protein